MIESAAVSGQEPLRLFEKVRAVVACALSAWLFSTVGGMMIHPSDPEAALSLAGHSSVVSRAVSAVVLSMVVTILAAVLGPARLPGSACLAVAVGWAALSWRGASIDYLLLYDAGSELPSRSGLFGRLAIESLFWCALAAGCLVLDRSVRRWLGPRFGENSTMAASSSMGGGAGGLRGRLLTVSVTAAVGAVVVSQFAARSPVAVTEKGQVYFSVLLGFYVGALIGLYFSFRVSPLLLVLPVGAVALLSYLWAAVHPLPSLESAAYRGLVGVLPNALCRPLPIEYASLGVIGVIVGGWSARNVYVPASEGM